MRFSIHTQLHELIVDNSKKHTKCTNNITPLHLSAVDLDKSIADTVFHSGKTAFSLLKHLKYLKPNDPNHKKRKSFQHRPKSRITNSDAVSHVASKLTKKKMINMKDSVEELSGVKLKLDARPTIEASKDTNLQTKQEPKVMKVKPR